MVGPNAVIQLRAALLASGQGACLPGLFGAAGHAAFVTAPPTGPLPEADIGRLFNLVAAHAREPERILTEAGRRTAEYLLAHRIPRAMTALLPRLPARLAAAILTHAMTRHAWTFAGSGRFTAEGGRHLTLSITANPLCLHNRTGCVWHEAVFQRLFQALVSERAEITEIACTGRGAPACRFEVGGV